MKPFSSSNIFDAKITPDVLLRAMAITSVVFNHAAAIPGRPFELGGGLNVLLLLSGYSFARFTLTQDGSTALRRSVVQFGCNLLLPCLALVLLSFVALRQWSWGELLFVSNFYQLDHISLLYTWYPQVILQMMVVFYLATFVPGVAAAVAGRPLMTSMVVLLVSYAGMQVFTYLTASLSYADRMVPYSMWNFVIGWVAYFAMTGDTRLALPGRIVLIGLAAVLGFYVFGMGGGVLRTVALVTAMAVMLLVDRVPLPTALARLATILSQAAFTIFLFHVPFLRAFDILHLRQFASGFHPRDVLFAWGLTMTGTVAIWIGLASLSRAWRFELSNHGVFGRPPAPA